MIGVRAGVGIVYGGYEMDIQQTTSFIEWLRESNPAIAKELNYPVGSCEFGAAWLDLYAVMPGMLSGLQYVFNKERGNI